MTPRGRRLLWLILGVGLAARIVLAFATVGQDFDIASLRIVASELDHPFDLYSTVNGDSRLGEFELLRWPYPPGMFPWLAVTVGIEKVTGLPFHGIVQLAAIAADIGIAWIVQSYLGRRGASEAKRLGAAALVMAGPAFWVVSGYHGQIDSLAFLPAVAALAVWQDGRPERRALLAGLLIGVGGAVKTVPLLMVVALLPTARSPREAVTLVASAAAVVLVVTAPFLLADFSAVRHALGYSGAPGLGGITMLAQPELSTAVLTQRLDGVELSSLADGLYDHGQHLVLVAVAVVAGFSLWLRSAPLQVAVLLWLAVYVVSPAFFFQYLVWGLPFFLMAGHLRAVAAVQVLIAAPLVAFYFLPWESDRVAWLYVPALALLWVAWVVALVAQGRRMLSEGRSRTALGTT